MVKSHLQALGKLVKTPKGYVCGGVDFPTLTAIQDAYQKNLAYRSMLQTLVIDCYQDKLMLVEETDYSPKEVSPGMTVEVSS